MFKELASDSSRRRSNTHLGFKVELGPSVVAATPPCAGAPDEVAAALIEANEGKLCLKAAYSSSVGFWEFLL